MGCCQSKPYRYQNQNQNRAPTQPPPTYEQSKDHQKIETPVTVSSKGDPRIAKNLPGKVSENGEEADCEPGVTLNEKKRVHHKSPPIQKGAPPPPPQQQQQQYAPPPPPPQQQYAPPPPPPNYYPPQPVQQQVMAPQMVMASPPVMVTPAPVIHMSPAPFYYDTCFYDPFFAGYYGGYGCGGFYW